MAVFDIRAGVARGLALGWSETDFGWPPMISPGLWGDGQNLDALLDELVEAHIDTFESWRLRVRPIVASHALYLKDLVR